MKAITVDQIAVVDADTCIGCGVCITHCPSEAMAFMRRPEQVEIPEDVAKHVG
jgi:ferredoxin